MKLFFDIINNPGYAGSVDAKSSTGIGVPESIGGHETADISNDRRFFCVQTSTLLLSLGRVEWGAVRLAGCLLTGTPTRSTLPILRLASQVGGKIFLTKRSTIIMTSITPNYVVVKLTPENQPIANSVDIALTFKKDHKNVLRAIESLLPELSEEYRRLNFEQTVVSRPNPKGGEPITSPAYNLTRDGFTLLAMGFTGVNALKFKIAYIEAFNDMEKELIKKNGPEKQVEAIRAELQRLVRIAVDNRVKTYTEELKEMADYGPPIVKNYMVPTWNAPQQPVQSQPSFRLTPESPTLTPVQTAICGMVSAISDKRLQPIISGLSMLLCGQELRFTAHTQY